MSALKTFNISKTLFYTVVKRQKRALHNIGLIGVNEEIRHALITKKPVVALESTIITHGMRYPHNLETALEVENIIKNQGALPATIAIIHGKIKVGLSSEDLEKLSKNQDECVKVCRRDIPYVTSQKLSGGTTVSGTVLISHKVGIPVFVTGGVGGVHRNGENTMDVSADLTELGRTPVAVISSGIKSILDIGRTLEYLETQGVAVASYGPTKNFPAFYTRNSGYSAPYTLKSPKEAAKFIQAIFDLNLNSGALIAVPVPETYSFDEIEIERAINEGIEESKKKNIRGKDVTPFLLERISMITKGQSLKSNIGLIKNNALIGAKISVELFDLMKKKEMSRIEDADLKYNSTLNIGFGTGEYKTTKEKDNFQVVVVGGSNLDHVINLSDEEIKPKAVFFTCVDSRMIPTRFTETDVGDMFVVRNAGNLIPHSRNYPDEITTTEPAVLELGCVINNVRHIIVCGHSDCKAMNLLYALRDQNYSSKDNRRISPLKAWMCAHANTSLDKFKTLMEDGFQKPLLFEAETPQRQFVAYIDPDNKFAIEDKLSQMDGRLLPGKVTQSGGGVARNVADALGKLGTSPFLISGIGDDAFGAQIVDNTLAHINTNGIVRFENFSTGICYVICDSSGECKILVGDMDIHQQLKVPHVKSYEKIILSSSLVVMDGNLPADTINYLLHLCNVNNIPVWFEPTDIVNATKAFQLNNGYYPNFVSPNYNELQEILKILNPSDSDEKCLITQGKMLARVVDNVIVTLGKDGVLICSRGRKEDPFYTVGATSKPKYRKNQGDITHRFYKPDVVLKEEVVNVSGAGDCFASGFITQMLKGENEESCVRFGFQCSLASLKNSTPVPESFGFY